MRVLVHLAVVGLLQRKVSLALMLLAVAVGVGFQIPNAANIDGYTRELQRTGVSRDIGHVLVTPRDAQTILFPAIKAQEIEKLPFVRGVTIRLARPGVIFGGKKRMGVRVVGVDVRREDRANGLCSRVGKGRCLNKPGGVLLGRRLADRLKLGVDSVVQLVVPHEVGGDIALARDSFLVAGVMKGGGGFQADYDVLVGLEAVRRMLRVPGGASQMAVYVDKPKRAPQYAKRIAKVVPKARVRPWQQVEVFVSRAIEANQQLARISMAMVVAAVVIPVLALLYIHVLQQRREIAVLAAVGFRRMDLFWIYLCKAAVVGFVGVGFGLAIGLGLTAYFDAHPLFEWSGFVVRPVLSARAIAVPSLFIWGATLLAGIAPAIGAARSNPSLTLRRD